MNAVFDDPTIAPVPETIDEALGASAPAWAQLADVLANAGVETAWRYYRDGGWVVRASRGSRTIAWMSVNRDYGRVTFFFAQRLRPALVAADDLPEWVKDAARDAEKMLSLTIQIRTSADVADAQAVLRYKLALK
ncbi:MAG: DUF3788 family protein [Propionibacteriaceae bacterium]|nr:DUF3788 family protein [Propionibacteriaceae bacterium]